MTISPTSKPKTPMPRNTLREMLIDVLIQLSGFFTMNAKIAADNAAANTEQYVPKKASDVYELPYPPAYRKTREHP